MSSNGNLKNSNSSVRKLKITFLKADSLPYEAMAHHSEYTEVIYNLIDPILKETSTDENIDLEISKYDVVERQYPSIEELRTIDAVIISGSFADSSIVDKMWVLRLCGFLIMLHDDFPHIRQIGICFGMQILARAFGPSKIIPNPKGWEVGSTDLILTDEGKQLLNPSSTSKKDVIKLQQIHRDIVSDMPDQFALLASSELTPIQAIAKYYNHNDPPRSFTNSDVIPEGIFGRVHIIGLQGHPELNSDVLLPLIKEYHNEGIFSKEYADQLIKQAKLPTDGKYVGRAILKILGVNSKYE